MHNSSHVMDILKICNMVEEYLNDSGHLKEFYSEFIRFKFIQLSTYILFSNSNDYFIAVRKELESFNRKDIPNDLIEKYDEIMNNNSFLEYKSFINMKNKKSNCDVNISVIIPVYNAEEYLSKCLDSVINQTLKDIEIICINDGSTDNSIEILKKYAKKDPRIIIIDKENGGAGSARNKGLKIAKGKYIHFIDADDWIDKDTYKITFEECETKNLDVILFQLINYENDTGKLYEDPNYNVEQISQEFDGKIFSHLDIKDVLFKLSVSPCNKLYKKDILKDITFPEGCMFEDNSFFFEAFLKTKRISIIRKHYYYRRVHSNSVMRNKGIKLLDSIEIARDVFSIVKKSDYYNVYKPNVINFRISMVRTWYNRIDNMNKPIYFSKMKKDFENIDSNETINYDFKYYLYEGDIKSFYLNTLKADTHKELDSLLAFEKINKENNHLKNETEQLKNENEQLKNELNSIVSENKILNNKNLNLKKSIAYYNEYYLDKLLLQNFNQTKELDFLRHENKILKINLSDINKKYIELISSNSWKLTKHFRNLKNFKR